MPHRALHRITSTTAIVAGKWKPTILWILKDGPLRYSELLGRMPKVAHKVVSQHLRELTSDGVVAREVGVGGPRRVRYGLTAAGAALIPILQSMDRWGLNRGQDSPPADQSPPYPEPVTPAVAPGSQLPSAVPPGVPPQPTRILIVEDRAFDVELIEHELRRTRKPYLAERVLDEAAFRQALSEFDPDIILTDHSLPTFNARDVVRIAKAERPDTPIIVVTGSLDEETAVEYLKAGASDYILKDRIRRLGPAVLRTLDVHRAHLEQKIADQALRQSEELLRAIVNEAPIAVYAVDRQGIVRSWNASATRIFGWTADDVIGKPSPISPVDHPEAELDFHATVMAGGIIRDLEAERRRRDGTAVTTRVYAAPLHGGTGEVAGAVVIAEDLTEIRAIEQHYYQAQKMDAIGRLAGGIAHDFNNMLTAILTEAELAGMDLAPDNPGRLPLEEIQRTARRAAELTRQLLAFARRQDVHPVLLNLNEVVDGLRRMLRRLIRADVEIVFRLASDLALARIDRGQMEQVIVNLAINARDAIPDRGTVTIETRNVVVDEAHTRTQQGVRPGGYVTLQVIDTGSGMTPDVTSRIFEPFYTTKGNEGTGLGLSTSYGIVKQAGGHITVQSTPGMGTTIAVYLPRI